MTFGSVVHKLRRVTVQEVSFRVKAALRSWCEERCYALGFHREPGVDLTRFGGEGIVFVNPWITGAEQATLPHRFLAWDQTYAQHIQKAAEAICDRRFTFFGEPVHYGSQIPWGADPLSGRLWPMRFHTQIDIFGGNTGNGDVKYVWELNRHQFLPLLGKAYCLTMDEKYAEAALELIEDWICTNPYKMGINWTSALEVAVRSLSWCWACSLLQDSKSFSLERRQNILRSLYQHGRYIEQYLSFFFSPYNHLIGEAAALFALGSLMPWLQPAHHWQETGWAILEQEMPKQFHPDGGTVEQALGYHHFTLGFYLQAVLLRQHQGRPVPAKVWSLLEKIFEFSMYIMRPDGSVPMIGDGDEGKALDLLQPSLWDFRCFLAIGAVLFERGDFKKMAGSFPPDAAWLVGSEGWDRYQTLTAEEPTETSKSLPESGYYVMRTGWDRQAHYLTFDCGEIASGVPKDDIPSAAHGHADALSIEVSSFGAAALVDPGFYTYNGDLDWHRYFRETEAHNTVVVDGWSQAEYCGRLTWSCAPHTALHYWVNSKSFDYVEGSHDGYTRLPQPVIHRRAVAFIKPDYWLVRDELMGDGEHQVDRYFHFACGEVVGDVEARAVRTQPAGGGGLAVLAVEKTGVAVEILQNGEKPSDGWLATGYEKRTRAPIARYRVRGRLPIALHTLLIPFRETQPDMQVDVQPVYGRVQSPVGQTVLVRLRGRQDIIFFSSATEIVPFYKEWLTDAHVAWMRLDEQGGVIACVLIGGSFLIIDGRDLLRLEKKLPFASLSMEQGCPVIELSDRVEVTTSFPHARIVISRNSQGIYHL